MKITAAQLRIPGDEVLERLSLGSATSGVRDRPSPKPRQSLVELLRDAVVLATLPGSFDQALLGFTRSVATVENPRHAHVIDVADAAAAKPLAFPSIHQLIV